MNARLAQLNAAPRDEAVRELMRCCGSSAWAERLADARPFATEAELGAAAERSMDALADADWREAFSHHPRIGERKLDRAAATATQAWSSAEQSGTAGAEQRVLDALVEGNRRYEEKFGHVFLICATGKPAREMLDALNARLGNDPDAELRIAAGQQRLITRLRIAKMLSE